jgi:mono/diheme cytochrome c family protein
MVPAVLTMLLMPAGASSATWTVVDSPWPDGVRPTAIAAGGPGAIWLVEGGADGGLGAIWSLTDRDGDRRFESASRFASGLIAPAAVLSDGPGSVLVLEPPNLVRLSDTDGDGQADANRIVAKAPDATGLARGSDGWVRLLGAGTSVEAIAARIRSRRSWPLAGVAVERPDGSWLAAQGSTVVAVVADDHAIARNPAMPAPWGTVVAETLEGEVLSLAADGDGALLLETVDGGSELRRRSLAVDGPRLSLGIPEPIMVFPRSRPIAMTTLADGSIAVALADGLRVMSDGREPKVPTIAEAGEAPDAASLRATIDRRSPAAVARAALVAGGLPDAAALPLFAHAFATAGADKSVRDAIVAGLAGREIALLEGLLAGPASDGPALDAMGRSAADSVLGSGDEPAIRRLVEFAARAGSRPAFREAILGRILAATEPNARLRRTLFVDLEPVGWRSLVASAASATAVAIDPHLRWPGRSDLPPLPDPDAGIDLLQLGRRVYSTCVTCHGSGGLGQPRVYPPLKASDWVLGDPRRLVRILLHGLQGPITVNGEPYASVMLLPRQLTDREIAAVLTYVRQAWGNDAEEVEESLVREIRSTTATRNAPWTSPELDEVLRGATP